MEGLSDQGLLDLHLDSHQLRKTDGTEMFSDEASILATISPTTPTNLHLFLQLVKELSVGGLSGDAGRTLGRQNGSCQILQPLFQRDLGAAGSDREHFR